MNAAVGGRVDGHIAESRSDAGVRDRSLNLVRHVPAIDLNPEVAISKVLGGKFTATDLAPIVGLLDFAVIDFVVVLCRQIKLCSVAAGKLVDEAGKA